VRAQRPHPQRVVAQMFGCHMGCALPLRKDVAHQMRAHASGEHGGGPRPAQLYRARKAKRIGPMPQARACDRYASGAYLVEVDAAAVEREHAYVEAALGQAGDQERPLPLRPARLQVRAYEHHLRRALPRRRGNPARTAFGVTHGRELQTPGTLAVHSSRHGLLLCMCDRSAASIIRTTSSPSCADERGLVADRIARQKSSI
jgi:hypothetical protein